MNHEFVNTCQVTHKKQLLGCFQITVELLNQKQRSLLNVFLIVFWVDKSLMTIDSRFLKQ